MLGDPLWRVIDPPVGRVITVVPPVKAPVLTVMIGVMVVMLGVVGFWVGSGWLMTRMGVGMPICRVAEDDGGGDEVAGV